MDEILTEALLVDRGAAGFEGGTLATVVPRAAIVDALEADEPSALLVLRLARANAAEDAGELSVSWDEGQLRELLQVAGDDGDVLLQLDGASVESALDADVVAHGLRERAAVVAVAVATVGATAGGAFAHATPSAAGQTGAGGGNPLARFAIPVASDRTDTVAQFQTQATGASVSGAADEAAIAAGAALVLTGAAFAAAHTRRRPARPA